MTRHLAFGQIEGVGSRLFSRKMVVRIDRGSHEKPSRGLSSFGERVAEVKEVIASSTTHSGEVLLRSASGAGVKTRLQEAQRQSWTISIFLRRVRLRVNGRAAAMRAALDGLIPEDLIDRPWFRDTMQRAAAQPRDGSRFAGEHLGYLEDVADELSWVVGRDVERIDDDGISRLGSPKPARARNPMRGPQSRCPTFFD